MADAKKADAPAAAAATEAKGGAPCCPPGAPGAIAAPPGATGSEHKHGDLNIYVSGTRSERGIIVFQEVFGIKKGRLYEICDKIAAAGFVVAIADYHRGDNFDTNGGDWSKFGAWQGATPWSKIQADLDTHVFPLLASKGATKFGAVGFCWGSWAVMHLSATGKLNAGAACHPSHTKLAAMSGEVSDTLVDAVKCPQLIYSAKDDPVDVQPGGGNQKILATKTFAAKNVFKHFGDVNHGWVSRGDLAVAENARDYPLALNGVIEFFKANV